jgi:micrococcal nuclease
MGLLRVLFGAMFGSPSSRRKEPQTTWVEPVRESPRATPSAQVVRPVTRPVLEHKIIRGRCWVVDGDTIVIDKVHIRLSGIDAPELDHPLGQKAKWALHALCKGEVITATTDGSVSHDRAVAICHLSDGRDLSAEMVKAGLALDWPKYSGGRYRHLETEDARKNLWRANARQHGRMVSTKPDC